VCSISAIGVDEGSLQEQLQQRAVGVQRLLERHARAGDVSPAAAPAPVPPSDPGSTTGVLAMPGSC
jgi:hypothetical protein